MCKKADFYVFKFFKDCSNQLISERQTKLQTKVDNKCKKTTNVGEYLLNFLFLLILNYISSYLVVKGVLYSTIVAQPNPTAEVPRVRVCHRSQWSWCAAGTWCTVILWNHSIENEPFLWVLWDQKRMEIHISNHQ